MNNTNHHIVQSYSTIIIPSSHPTTNCRPSPYRQLDSSQSDDLLDPIYSVIQYPLNTGALQSTQSLSPSSGCDYSEGSMNQRQFIEPHRLLLAKDIWTSQVI
ncbi:unnamed protein product [Trichobilharzia regenti]|nr:unnamed protein product [Trichobilharzia regenti]